MTTNGLTTCLWFDGQAEEAANHYVSIFEGSKLGKIGRHTEAGPLDIATLEQAYAGEFAEAHTVP